MDPNRATRWLDFENDLEFEEKISSVESIAASAAAAVQDSIGRGATMVAVHKDELLLDAASRGELSLVEQLLDAKANVDAKDSVRTPLLSLSRARPCPCCFRR